MTKVEEFKLPDLGEGLTEGEILKWLVSVGETVTLNQPIVEVETAKAAVEIPAKWAGRVTAIFRPAGETVEVGTPIIAIDTEPDAGDVPDGPDTEDGPVEAGLTGGSAPGGRTAVLVGYGPKTAVAKRRARKDTVLDAPAADFVLAPEHPSTPAALAKPPVRKLARDLGVELTGLAGSGPNGSITRDDVLAAQGFSPPAGFSPETGSSAAATAPSFGVDREQRIPVKGVRKLTAENMVASAFSAPHVTEFLTVDVTRSMRALDRLRALPGWRGTRVSPLLLVAKAVLVALRRHPMVNSSWRGAEIVVKEYVNLGIAAATERGLIVPNIKDAGRLSVRELADALNALVSVAKDGRTAPADMSGGTFTITNVGVFGVDTGTPILPPGEAAILVFGAIREQPWAYKGKVKLRQVTTLGLSFDHRIIDGELGSRFLSDVGAFLADPEAALLAWS
jgi:2-oxoisovalerate dehydrogenase E2 component (dihydrolipoyl transacylase)